MKAVFHVPLKELCEFKPTSWNRAKTMSATEINLHLCELTRQPSEMPRGRLYELRDSQVTITIEEDKEK